MQAFRSQRISFAQWGARTKRGATYIHVGGSLCRTVMARNAPGGVTFLSDAPNSRPLCVLLGHPRLMTSRRFRLNLAVRRIACSLLGRMKLDVRDARRLARQSPLQLPESA